MQVSFSSSKPTQHTLLTQVLCGLLTITRAWSRDHTTSSVTADNQFGDGCFATAGPMLRNSLPEQLWQPDITFGHSNDR